MPDSPDDKKMLNSLGIACAIILLIAVILVLARTPFFSKVVTFGGPTPAYGETPTGESPSQTTTITTEPTDQFGEVCVDLTKNPYAVTAHAPCKVR